MFIILQLKRSKMMRMALFASNREYALYWEGFRVSQKDLISNSCSSTYQECELN